MIGNINYIIILIVGTLICADSRSLSRLPDNTLSEASLATLKFVAVISRHGSRTPLETYPNDPYPYNNKMFWPTGPDELTAYGKKQLYQIGENLRERYRAFLPQEFFPNDTIGLYNKNDRDFMSAACILAGLYPPVGTDVWNHDLLWQPIPLKIRTFDVCSLPYENHCPAYRVEAEALVNQLNSVSQSNLKTKTLMESVSQLTGENVSGTNKLFDIYDILNMQHENGFKLPAWAQKYYPQPLRSVATPLLVTKYGGSDKLLSLGAGPELKYISDIFTMKRNGTYNDRRKFYIETSHDCTLIAILRALGNINPNLEIKTSGYMIFELHYIPEMYIVQALYYDDSTVTKPEIVNFASCPTPCSLENFTKFIDSINPPDWKKSCQDIPQDNSEVSKESMFEELY